MIFILLEEIEAKRYNAAAVIGVVRRRVIVGGGAAQGIGIDDGGIEASRIFHLVARKVKELPRIHRLGRTVK